jgi:hypothetical protein
MPYVASDPGDVFFETVTFPPPPSSTGYICSVVVAGEIVCVPWVLMIDFIRPRTGIGAEFDTFHASKEMDTFHARMTEYVNTLLDGTFIVSEEDPLYQTLQEKQHDISIDLRPFKGELTMQHLVTAIRADVQALAPEGVQVLRATLSEG